MNKRQKEIILYLFFGVCTTIINMACYGVLYELLGVANIVSTIIAWLLAVIFAFYTNREYVFNNNKNGTSSLEREFISFLGCRIFTGMLDVVIMFIAVDVMMGKSLIWKLVSNVVVTVLNYVASKFLIFK